MGLCKKKSGKDRKGHSVMKNTIWETGAFFGVPASFFYPTFVADSSRIYCDLCGFIGGFERFHLDESGTIVKMNGMGCLDGWEKGNLMEGCGTRDEIVNQKK